MSADAEVLGRMGPELRLLLPMLDERSRRLVLGAVARAAGDGGTGAVASLTGASWQTVADGAAEVGSGESAPAGRVRRPGAGRRRLEDTDPGLLPALEALVADAVRGDPESPLTWTTRSVKRLAGELTAAGHPCSPVTAWRLLRRAGYTLQSNSKAAEGRQHPERDAQFRYIAAQAREHMQYPVMGDRLPAIAAHRHSGALTAMAADRLINRPASCHDTGAHRGIVALNLARSDCAHERGMCLRCACNDQQPARVLVQPMHQSGARYQRQFAIEGQQRILQRVGCIARTGMHDLTCGLVDD